MGFKYCVTTWFESILSIKRFNLDKIELHLIAKSLICYFPLSCFPVFMQGMTKVVSYSFFLSLIEFLF